ncbi:citrate synthase [Neoehrlichia mikurensis]|uniref:Citrate synthase n=7 Tax=Neoehrlichia mikurensis TaxID=89586 RepID=A0A9Q9C1Y5_9RICK|nr:citrate synthase [Neoehrlichia mikurensis]QXK92268.1 citrate synthase [Neoehrlichia mikurensis]QXK92722.1 citrate synthase [Neoehrlichia mikurensis]UTO55874.1 citrate synthase [Neoehrlichia mikurensis]UTO56790.1 citrate synthase [Neoehrlichia mikurensis]
MVKKAVLSLDNEQIELQVLHGSCGPDVLDIRSLYKNSQVFVYDPGFMSTAACASKITFIDGEKGILRYRGYDIEYLVNMQHSFLEIAYLLFYGVLPNKDEFENFSCNVIEEHSLPQQVYNIIQSFPRNSHPMAILSACFATLSAHYHDSEVVNDYLRCAILSVAKVPSIIAAIYRYIVNKDIILSHKSLSYSRNFANMMLLDFKNDKVNDVVAKALDVIFILHADHEQNASTASVRLAGSAGANLFACLSAGAVTLWGPAHGGANEAVIRMLMKIGDPKNVQQFIQEVKDKKSKLMGFGHRVYKNYDPRARVLKSIYNEIFENLCINDPLLEIAIKLEAVALKDDYFIERKLYPNIDFYSGLILNAIGIPVNMFTALFALARTVGWSAQWCEMRGDNSKICRPRQLYIGM